MSRNSKDEMYRRIIRKRVNEDRYGIIGVEIKSRRIKKGITLEALSDSICSQSYLCKIEMNKIEPNKVILRELCSRLDLSNEKLDSLFSLKEILVECVKAFISSDIDVINKAYENGNGLENYRFSILRLMYYLANKKIGQAVIVADELKRIVSSMSDFDLTIYSVFCGLLSYYKAEFDEALDSIEYIDHFVVPTDLKVLKNLLDFKIRVATNSADSPYYYEKVRRDLFDKGYFKLMDENKYLICLYYIRNNCESAYKEMIKTVNNKIDNQSLKCIRSFYEDNYSLIIDSNNSNINEFVKAIKLIIVNQSEAKGLIDLNLDYYRIDYDVLLLQYLMCDNYKDKIDYIFKIGLPMAVHNKDGFLKKYFINQLMKMPIALGRNRNLSKAYILAYGEENMVFDYGDLDEN